MIKGTNMEGKFPMKLNAPAVTRSSVSEPVGNQTQMIDAIPFPKKAMAINKIISEVL